MFEASLIVGVGSFCIGFLFGSGAVWLIFNNIHSLLEEIDQKYNRLVTLMSEWQKKL